MAIKEKSMNLNIFKFNIAKYYSHRQSKVIHIVLTYYQRDRLQENCYKSTPHIIIQE